MINFATIQEIAGKRYIVTMPGQTMSKRALANKVSGGILVKPEKGNESLFISLRKKSAIGSIFWTKNLKSKDHCYSANDLSPLSLVDSPYEAIVAWCKYVATTDRYNETISKDYLVDIITRFCGFMTLSSISYQFYADAANDVANELEVPGESKAASNLLSGLKFEEKELYYEALSEDKESLFTCRKITSLDKDTLLALLKNLVLIYDEMSKTGCHVSIDEFKFITEEGEMFIPVGWPDVQELFEKKGFRKNSILITEPEEYDQYGDSAYWVRYRWLFPKKK